ncbi:GntR family transcriptional regulator [Litoreibacter roseus]|uniref:GntR C-terminal domain-containing protein n=1 Tax=Litoreibacter roseus TaxID=2601869 RepID=A0A6N6JAG2_9RHOB|nr:FCD domain-containing protein [Litoreibacter roseus]GFE63233.1 hypothetical protein KIN_03070 [Litoreibacter roseus]
MAVEIKVLRKTAATWDGSGLDELNSNLKDQRSAVDTLDFDEFHALDYHFHRLLCRVANADMAFEVIAKNKAQVDRLCVLSLTEKDRMEQLLDDHEEILKLLKADSRDALEQAIRTHLARLDSTVEAVWKSHSDYFED